MRGSKIRASRRTTTLLPSKSDSNSRTKRQSIKSSTLWVEEETTKTNLQTHSTRITVAVRAVEMART